MTGDNIKVVELFAGVGGFRVGLEQSKGQFETVLANQWEPNRKNQFAADCYKINFGDNANLINEDVNDIYDRIPNHDLLVGGFPCQDYSVASTNAQGIKGKKGVLWWNIEHIVKTYRPKYVLLENVDRLLRSPVRKRGRDFGIILRCLADLGYAVEWRTINASDYGYQQRRRRVFIFAIRSDMEFAETYSAPPLEVLNKKGFFAKSFPVKDKAPAMGKSKWVEIGAGLYEDIVAFSDNFQADFHRAGFMKDYAAFTCEVEVDYDGDYTSLMDILQKDAPEEYVISGERLDKWRYVKSAKRIPRTRKDGSRYMYCEGAIPFPDILDRAGRTILTSEGNLSRTSHIISDPVSGEYRTLTPLECERLNGFPDDWTDTGMSKRQRYFCMGNALVIPLITKMGDRIYEIHEKQKTT